MNCFAHALRFLDDAYFVVGTCVPDWLSACDRKCRAREAGAERLLDSENGATVSLARGVIQHHRDDDWFHKTLAFNELSMQFSLEIRALLGNESGFRPGLLGHIIVELFLDAYLDETYPGRLEDYYSLVNSIDPSLVQEAVSLMANRPTTELKHYIGQFQAARYLFDYRDDEKLIFRVNQVFRRIKLAPLGTELSQWLVPARRVTYARASELLPVFSLPKQFRIG